MKGAKIQVNLWEKNKLILLITVLLVSIPSAQSFGNQTSDAAMVAGRKFFTDGPIRYAPAMWEGKTYAGSDDGYLYCFDEDGQVLWKFFGGYSNRKLIMVGRLVSAWHVSGGPVAADGRVYFAAGTWPSMGVFIHALDAQTGEVIWTNDTSNAIWYSENFTEPKSKEGNKPTFISVAPKGQLSIDDGKLVVPCGRAAPAYLDLKTGELLSFHMKQRGYRSEYGGSWPYSDYKAITQQTQKCFPADETANEILRATGVRAGYCLVLGIGDGRLVEGLVAQSELQVIAIGPDAKKVASLRQRLDDKGVYGVRASVHVGNPLDFELPPYMASLVVSGDPKVVANGLSENVFQALRPYGGTICLPMSAESALSNPSIENTELARDGKYIQLRRIGPLSGSDDWSHEQANSCNTRCSADQLVKAPLGVLWFGGPADNLDFYYGNHRKLGQPQVIGGRMFIEGPGMINAFDVYTGRHLWQWRPEDDEQWDIDHPSPTSKERIPVLAGRMASSEGALYAVSDRTVYALDAATGEPVWDFESEIEGNWGSVKVWNNTLFVPTANRIMAMDRHTGDIAWICEEAGGTLAVGGGKVFCLDSSEPDRYDYLERRGEEQGEPPPRKLVAIDAHTGEILWDTTVPVRPNKYGAPSRLVYAENHDVLVEPETGRAYSGKDGANIWNARLDGFRWLTMLRGDTFLQSGLRRVDAATGESIVRRHPLTLAPYTLPTFKTGHGCGAPVGSEHLLTFRSGMAAYIDLTNEAGIVNVGGFKSGCSANMIAANGVLVAPIFASTCVCTYPIWSSLVMIHMPEVEAWSSYGLPHKDKPPETRDPVRRVGINFGAPGDRRAENGTLWVDCPSVGGLSFDIPVKTVPEQPEWFRYHSSRVADGNLKWVSASGARELKSVTITLGNPQPRSYRVRVYYVEIVRDGPIPELREIMQEENGIQAEQELVWNFDDGKLVCGIEVVDSTLVAGR